MKLNLNDLPEDENNNEYNEDLLESLLGALKDHTALIFRYIDGETDIFLLTEEDTYRTMLDISSQLHNRSPFVYLQETIPGTDELRPAGVILLGQVLSVKVLRGKATAASYTQTPEQLPLLPLELDETKTN